jgi:hypothetical protein
MISSSKMRTSQITKKKGDETGVGDGTSGEHFLRIPYHHHHMVGPCFWCLVHSNLERYLEACKHIITSLQIPKGPKTIENKFTKDKQPKNPITKLSSTTT